MNFETKIDRVTSEFDNLQRLESKDFLLDVYVFDKPWSVGDVITYSFSEKFPGGVVLNGKVIKVLKPDTAQVSFGGLLGSFKGLGYKLDDIVSLSYQK